MNCCVTSLNKWCFLFLITFPNVLRFLINDSSSLDLTHNFPTFPKPLSHFSDIPNEFNIVSVCEGKPKEEKQPCAQIMQL